MSPRRSPSKNFSKAQILGKGSDSCEAGRGPKAGGYSASKLLGVAQEGQVCMVLVELQTYQ